MHLLLPALLAAIAVLLTGWDEASAQAPAGEAWQVSRGGKLYDNHWTLAGEVPPGEAHPAFPAGADIPPESTWRCSSCHGWDYRGGEGHLSAVPGTEGFPSLRHLNGADPAIVAEALTSEIHKRLSAPLEGDRIDALALFLTRGQHDTRKLAPDGVAVGDPLFGRDIYEGACMSCHQADGKAWIEGEHGDVAALGWVAVNRPEQALHKIRNGVPGADMLSLRFLKEEQIADLLAYLQTLDTEAE